MIQKHHLTLLSLLYKSDVKRRREKERKKACYNIMNKIHFVIELGIDKNNTKDICTGRYEWRTVGILFHTGTAQALLLFSSSHTPQYVSALIVSIYFRTNPLGFLITIIMSGFPTTVFVVNRTNIIVSQAKVSCLFSMKTLKLWI
jgi:hypothetical protein